jgi:hypothetical protein
MSRNLLGTAPTTAVTMGTVRSGRNNVERCPVLTDRQRSTACLHGIARAFWWSALFGQQGPHEGLSTDRQVILSTKSTTERPTLFVAAAIEPSVIHDHLRALVPSILSSRIIARQV